MSSFSQAVSQLQKGQIKRVTWICGSEPSLREEVLDGIRRVGAFGEVVRRVAGEDSENEIWDAINQYSFDAATKRLVIIRDAERISNWAPLRDWMANSRRMPNTYLIFMTSELRLRHDELPDRKEKLAEPLDFISNRGSMIECRTPNVEDFTDWITWRTGTPPGTGKQLIRRCGGDIPSIQNVVRMAAALGIPLTPNLVDLLAVELSPPDFSHNLMMLDKKAALGSIPDGQGLLRAIGTLDRLLDVMIHLHPLLRRQAPMRDVADEKKVPVHLARQLLPHAKHYDPHAVRRRREVLASIDEVAQRCGPVKGLGESLVALWCKA